jgi:hypothetical protein
MKVTNITSLHQVVSVLGAYLLLQAIQSTTIVLITLIQLRLYYRTVDTYPIGAYWRCLVTVTNIFCCKNNKSKTTKVQPEVSAIKSNSKKTKVVPAEVPERDGDDDISWKHVVSALDLLFFIGFCVVVASTTTVMFALASQRGG